jgi:hypothetical protein
LRLALHLDTLQRNIEVARVRITDAGRRALAGAGT